MGGIKVCAFSQQPILPISFFLSDLLCFVLSWSGYPFLFFPDEFVCIVAWGTAFEFLFLVLGKVFI